MEKEDRLGGGVEIPPLFLYEVSDYDMERD